VVIYPISCQCVNQSWRLRGYVNQSCILAEFLGLAEHRAFTPSQELRTGRMRTARLSLSWPCHPQKPWPSSAPLDARASIGCTCPTALNATGKILTNQPKRVRTARIAPCPGVRGPLTKVVYSGRIDLLSGKSLRPTGLCYGSEPLALKVHNFS